MNKIPDWLKLALSDGLIGEIYPAIRAVAVQLNDQELIIRYYLDRAPEEFDFDSLKTVCTNLYSATSEKVPQIKIEATHGVGPWKDEDALDGFVYVRREYE